MENSQDILNFANYLSGAFVFTLHIYDIKQIQKYRSLGYGYNGYKNRILPFLNSITFVVGEYSLSAFTIAEINK